MNRASSLHRVADERASWDLVVIGGGATGFGAAVDAAARGYRTLLLEQNDFGKGTSSRSTKLVHGGVRYLRQGRIGLVRDSLRERGLLLRNAPHLAHPLPFIIPSYRASDTLLYGAGLKVYDLLAGTLGLGRTRVLNAGEVMRDLPGVEPRRLRGGIRYFDGQFDDARLLVALAQTLFDLGGIALNYVSVSALLKSDGRVRGVIARDVESGRELSIPARAVINATGVFTDAVRRLDAADAPALIAPSQGSHVVLDRSFQPGPAALMIPRTPDGRVLFAIPWHRHLLVGTTDIAVDRVDLEPRPRPDEIEFILGTASRYLARHPTDSDVLSSFAGLRPLVASGGDKSTAQLGRDHRIEVSPSRLVTVTGGKWTTYRQMGEDAVNHAIAIGGLALRPSRTKDLPLHGWTDEAAAPKGGTMTEDERWRGYGTDANAVRELAKELSDAPLHPRLPYGAAEVIWAARHEMARTVEDVLARRTRALFLDARAAMESAPAVAALLAPCLGRDSRWQQQQVDAFNTTAKQYLPG